MNKELSKTIKTPDSHDLELLHAITEGRQNKVAILMHGLFTDKHENGRFDRLTDRLVLAGFDVIRFDFRGHGKSAKNNFTLAGGTIDFRSVLLYADTFGYKDFHIISSSFGASIFLLYLQCEQVVSFSSSVMLNPVSDYQGMLTDPRVEWGRLVFTEEKIEEILSQGKALVLNGFTVSMDFLNELQTILPYGSIDSINFPLLVLHGDCDQRVSHELSRKHFSKNKQCFLDIVKGAGHAFKNEKHELYVHKRTVEWIAG